LTLALVLPRSERIDDPAAHRNPGHESSDARGAKRVRGLAPPLRPTAEGGLELDVIFERHRFRELMSLLESEPEWHDGELVHTAHDH